MVRFHDVLIGGTAKDPGLGEEHGVDGNSDKPDLDGVGPKISPKDLRDGPRGPESPKLDSTLIEATFICSGILTGT
jgi:hypothetical protein